MAASNLPASVILQEEGPREGFQSEPPIAAADKLRLIHALAETGLRDINCVSFVDTRRVPQMVDAEAVAAGLQRRPEVRYTGLWLNGHGFDRARFRARPGAQRVHQRVVPPSRRRTMAAAGRSSRASRGPCWNATARPV